MNMSTPLNRTRRSFLKSTGAIIVSFAWGMPGVMAQQAAQRRLPGSLQTNRALDAWLRINTDGTVTVYTGKAELGQGILTALAQIAADELDVGYEHVQMISADTSRTPNEGYTAGSQSVENSGTALRYACAEARDILLGLAEKKLGVPKTQLSVSDGTVSGGSSRVTYSELAQQVNLKREATAQVKPKAASLHSVIGKRVSRRDVPGKMTGKPSYVQDLRLPGMVFGRVVRPPSYRAQLVSYDEAAVRALPGIVAVARDGSFLAVAAEREEQAINAAQTLRASAKWRESPDLPPAPPGLFQHLQKVHSVDSVVSEKTSVVGGGRVKTIEATYTRPFQAHASMSASCAAAQFKEGKLTVWTHSQGVFPLRKDLAQVLRVPETDITAIHVEGSGCYGHNGADDVACDAALLARATGGRPVKVQWMRDDEFSWEPYGSAMLMKMRARVNEAGDILHWQHEVWSHPHSTRPGARGGSNLLAGWHIAQPLKPAVPVNSPQPAGAADRNAVPGYDFPQHKVILHYLPEMPIRTSALRTLGAYANVFALESFIDELAANAGADPVEYRLRYLKNPRSRAVIEAAAQKAGWKPNQRGDGTHGRGFAFAQYKNHAVYVAIVADVVVDRRTGKVRVTRAVSAVDAGLIINPDGLSNQIEGGIIQSTSWTLKEAVRYDTQRIITRSWADYPILTFPEVPAVEVVLLNRPDEQPLGAGEGSQGPTVAAIANAIHNATGVRLRDLPFTPERVKSALAGARADTHKTHMT
ncbi:MAG TPA: molybdopterin cofactor-binding domain-containing protein [Burkholderiales bacterium]|nr:molybdopterin cofactor-binding domain-containing protein [Burkholderiales bacterium]